MLSFKLMDDEWMKEGYSMGDFNKSSKPHTDFNKASALYKNNTGIMVTVNGRGEPFSFEYDGSGSLMEALQSRDIYVSASCGGRGTCGKCKIRLIEGKLEVTPSDRVKLSEDELRQGYRLSCMTYPAKTCTISVVAGDEADFEIVAGKQTEATDSVPATGQSDNPFAMDEDYGIAIDIGTTTLALSLVGLTGKQVIDTYTAINKQRAYGADVISRIKASVEGKRDILKTSIQKDLQNGIRSLLMRAGIESDNRSNARLKRIAIAGNTTMEHLLLGYPCDTLGSYPFTPFYIKTVTMPYAEAIGADDTDAEVTVLPGISAFVGGDIVAGLLACGFDRKDSNCLLIDLGTNGEMALGNRNKLLVTSTAAGPAFEGGNISCGTGSVSGAICGVEIRGSSVIVETIGQKPPVGICGTGVIELVSELLKAGLMDETGLLCEEYFDRGFEIARDIEGRPITFTQKDIRELQLAKAAIRAGVEILLQRSYITYEDIDTVYLAGGFGYQLNLEKAFHVGLLPKELSGRVKAVGNSSLDGAILSLTEKSAAAGMEQIVRAAEELHLSNDIDFNDLYIRFMGFEI